MEPNSTPDKFEEFLRRSLEHYEESPPEAAWNHVFDRIPTVPQSQPVAAPKVFTFSKWKLAYAASLIMLLSAVAYQYVAQTNQLAQTQAAFVAVQAQMLHAQVELEKLKAAMSAQEQNVIKSTTIYNGKLGNTQTAASQQIASLESSRSHTIGSGQNSKINGANLTSSPTRIAPEAAVIPSEQASVTEPAGLGTEPVFQTEHVLQNAAQENQLSEEITSDLNPPKVVSVTALPRLKSSILEPRAQHFAPKILVQPIVQLAVKPHQGLRLWVNTGVGFTEQDVVFRPDGRNKPIDHSLQDYDKDGMVAQYGVHVEKRLNSKWSLLGGIAYTKLTQEARSKIRLKPKFGGPGGPGQQGDSLDFTYTIQTGEGVADIEIRASDVSQMHQNDEADISLETKETSTNLLLPVSLKYSAWKKGRLSAFVTAGGAISVPLNRKLEIEDVTIQSPLNLHPFPKLDQRSEIRNDGTINLDAYFLASAGVEYAINERLSLSVSPQLAIKANQNLDYGWANHSFKALSLQVGLGYQL